MSCSYTCNRWDFNQADCFHELSCKDLLPKQDFLAEKGLAGHLVTVN